MLASMATLKDSTSEAPPTGYEASDVFLYAFLDTRFRISAGLDSDWLSVLRRETLQWKELKKAVSGE